MRGKYVQRWKGRLGALRQRLVPTFALAVGCNVALESTGSLAIGSYPWVGRTPALAQLFLLGTLIIWAVVGLVHALLGRIGLTLSVMAAATTLVAVANYEKLVDRREPVYPGAVRFAGDPGFLLNMVGTRVVVFTVAMLLIVGAFGVVVTLRERMLEDDPTNGPLRRRLASRIATGAMCLLALGYVAQFNSPGNLIRGTYDAFGARWIAWSQASNYLANGFVGGLLYNLNTSPVSPPRRYGEDVMGRIVSTYSADAQRINGERSPGVIKKLNVVLVLSESFSDPSALRGVTPMEDPIPFTRKLLKDTTSGPMLTEGIGGGTANMEFEALTGLSNSQFPPQLRVPYQMLVPGHRTFPSVVTWFEETGHKTVAVHPFTTEMYRRLEVYRAFGFDSFIYDHLMRDQRRIGHDAYLSDAAAFDEVVAQLRGEPQPLFVNLVTMQNHMPYTGRYDNPFRVIGPDGAALPVIGQYARGLAHSDRALQRFIRRLKHFDEPTVVVFFGDHLPSGYPPAVFDANDDLTMHQTPFFVWANFPGARTTEPITSPIHFVDIALERANAPVPPFLALLHELREEIPAMENGRYLGSDGRALDSDALSPRARRLLRDYRLVQYDLSSGQRYSADAMFRLPAD